MDCDVKQEATENELESNNAVTLLVHNIPIAARKDLLSKHSDYFQAMFSGHYIEHEQKEIKIDILGPDTMTVVLEYMERGTLDLNEHDLTSLAYAANILQMSELIKLITNELYHRLSVETWLETMILADELQWQQLLTSSLTYGLVSFDHMKVEYIKCIHTLCWYLSHPTLYVDNEYQVFKFGFDWVVKNEFPTEAFLAILGCLDVRALRKIDLAKIINLLSFYENSLPDKISKCLLSLADINLPLDVPSDGKEICEKHSENVYSEVVLLLNTDFSRVSNLSPCVYVINDIRTISNPMDEAVPPEKAPHHLALFSESEGLRKWIYAGTQELWGWSMADWGKLKLVVVGGEFKRGSGNFNREVAVYDILLEKWINHDTQLPHRRHAGITILGDQLFIAGGLGKYRLQLTTSIIYDLVKRTYVQIADIPDPIQSPAMCSHKGEVYLASTLNMYKYVPGENGGSWKMVFPYDSQKRPNRLVSCDDYIYVSSYYDDKIVRFKPGEGDRFEVVCVCLNPVYTMCKAGRKLIAFTLNLVEGKWIYAEECPLDENVEAKIIWKQESKRMKVCDAAGCCLVIAKPPQTKCELSAYTKKYLALFPKRE